MPSSAVCDGNMDCNDFSDESACRTWFEIIDFLAICLTCSVPNFNVCCSVGEFTAGPPGGLNLKTYPVDQTIKQGMSALL